MTKNSLYLHIPFCNKKCFYCSFVVFVSQRYEHIDFYLKSLLMEARNYKKTKLNSVYVGGGTPSILDEGQLSFLVEGIREAFIFSDNVEFSIEVNPEDVTHEKAKHLLSLGINRVSMGVQSFQNNFLKKINRSHTVEQSKKAYHLLREVGFRNINLDLIFALPGETIEEVEQDVAEVVRLGSEHISLYSLTVDKHSRFFLQNIQEHSGEVKGDQYKKIMNMLSSARYDQYEISNFSKTDFCSQHNLNYWQGGNYIGIGAGAHSHQNGVRQWNVSAWKTYVNRIKEGMSPVESSEVLSDIERLKESLVFGLRMNQGVELNSLEQKYQCVLGDEERNRVDQFVSEGFLVWEKSVLMATEKGRLVLDEISAYLI